jgi:hypothetical protein
MAYRIAGNYIAVCSCSLICPCPVDGRPTDPEGKGECRGAAVFQIDEGNQDGTDLSGIAFGFYNLFPSNLTAGNWKVGVVIDEGASEEQAQALQRILSGGDGGVFGELAALFGENLGTERGRVTFSDGDSPSATVEGKSEIRFEPIPGPDGSPTTVKGAMYGFAPEYMIGKGSGRSSAFGLTFEPRYGEAAAYEFSSEMAAEAPHGRM